MRIFVCLILFFIGPQYSFTLEKWPHSSLIFSWLEKLVKERDDVLVLEHIVEDEDTKEVEVDALFNLKVDVEFTRVRASGSPRES